MLKQSIVLALQHVGAPFLAVAIVLNTFTQETFTCENQCNEAVELGILTSCLEIFIPDTNDIQNRTCFSNFDKSACDSTLAEAQTWWQTPDMSRVCDNQQLIALLSLISAGLWAWSLLMAFCQIILLRLACCRKIGLVVTITGLLANVAAPSITVYVYTLMGKQTGVLIQNALPSFTSSTSQWFLAAGVVPIVFDGIALLALICSAYGCDSCTKLGLCLSIWCGNMEALHKADEEREALLRRCPVCHHEHGSEICTKIISKPTGQTEVKTIYDRVVSHYDEEEYMEEQYREETRDVEERTTKREIVGYTSEGYGIYGDVEHRTWEKEIIRIPMPPVRRKRQVPVYTQRPRQITVPVTVNVQCRCSVGATIN